MAIVRINVSALNDFVTRTVQPYLAIKAEEIANEARARAPEGATGELKGSIHVERTPKGGVNIKVDALHAGFVHQGTGPGHIPDARPSYYPKVRKKGLVFWADAKGANPYKVAAGIAKNGTKANPFLEEAIQKVLTGFQFRWIKTDINS